MTVEDKDHSERVPTLRDAILSSKGCPRDPSREDVPHIPIDTPEFLLRFLVCAKGDVDKSVARHNHYWEVRGELFSIGGDSSSSSPSEGGDERHDNPPPLCRDFDAEKCEKILAERPFIVAPEGATDAFGRQLVYVRPRFLNWKEVTTREALECVWYRIDRVLATNTRGLIHVGNLKGFSLTNFNKDFVRAIVKSVFGAMPVRVFALRVCNTPFAFKMAFAFVYPFLPDKINRRVMILGSDYEGPLAELLPRESVPEALGGSLKVFGDVGSLS